MILDDLRLLLPEYEIAPITEKECGDLFRLQQSNEYYFSVAEGRPVTYELAVEGLTDLPPNTPIERKTYAGFYRGGRMEAILDYIVGYPDGTVVWIGLFMIDNTLHRKGIGRRIVGKFADACAQNGFAAIQLGVIEENERGFAFWTAQGFSEVRRAVCRGEGHRDWLVLAMERRLAGSGSATSREIR